MTAGPRTSAERVVVDVVGVRVEVLSEPGSPRLRTAMATIAESTAARSPANRAVDCTVDLRGVSLTGDKVEDALGLVARVAIDRSADLLLHAGLVSRGSQAVLIPGPSGTGKSTVTAACLRRGFDYLTDEMVAVELGTTRARGWPRPLMLTARSVAAVGLSPDDELAEHSAAEPPKAAIQAARLGARVRAGPVTVTDVVVARLGADVSTMTPAPADEVLGELLAASFNHYRFGVEAWEAAVRLARGAAGWRLDIAEIDVAADLIAGLGTTYDGRGSHGVTE